MSPNATDTSGNYVSAVEVSNGRVDITFGGPRAHQAIFGQTLSVTPYETNGNTIVWRCGNVAAAMLRSQPVFCFRAAHLTSHRRSPLATSRTPVARWRQREFWRKNTSN
jgi:hypothetical protein